MPLASVGSTPPRVVSTELTATPEFGPDDPLEVELDASASEDPDGLPLSYEWDLDGDGTFETSGVGDELTVMSGF